MVYDMLKELKMDIEEIKEILIATIYVAFMFGFSISHPQTIIYLFPLYLLISLVSFIPHELAHKYMAIKYGCKAYFKMWKEGMLFSIFLAFFGFKLIVPGAVMIYPYRFSRWEGMKRITLKESAMISLVGPITNILIGVALYFIPNFLAQQIALLNFWLAFFNLLPIPPLDGSKIIFWNFVVWLITILIPSVFLFII